MAWQDCESIYIQLYETASLLHFNSVGWLSGLMDMYFIFMYVKEERFRRYKGSFGLHACSMGRKCNSKTGTFAFREFPARYEICNGYTEQWYIFNVAHILMKENLYFGLRIATLAWKMVHVSHFCTHPPTPHIHPMASSHAPLQGSSPHNLDWTSGS